MPNFQAPIFYGLALPNFIIEKVVKKNSTRELSFLILNRTIARKSDSLKKKLLFYLSICPSVVILSRRGILFVSSILLSSLHFPKKPTSGKIKALPRKIDQNKKIHIYLPLKVLHFGGSSANLTRLTIGGASSLAFS